MRITLSLIILCVCVFMTGCQANSANSEGPKETTADQDHTPFSTAGPASPTEGGTTPMPPTIPTFTASGTERLIEMAKADLAQRLSIPSAQISLAEITEVEWSDSSLGCPQPGMDYLQVITPGYRLLLESAGSQYEYHSNRDTYVVYCENSILLVPPPKP